ncbi:hypothetical protein CEF21_00670 [Bacillus sp. FJAT-42376]|uniref:hypothetical protein n=1 Tax=Bacillus sp. FJAT-42376 TaxID=2014076 RepID=UPI000F4E39E4|nr:hypothetical protein [Bacillus sp. FJAT-42376]AZB40975.1 hypothetical protein CEF21_00670 [Bacillus sp. FJAT-42376]
MPELLLILLIAYAVCFILFSVLFALLYLASGKKSSFKQAAEDVVDLFVLTPAGWFISILYFLYLVAVFPFWWLSKRK